MDADRFDTLIRALTDAISRRGLSRRLTALTVTGVLGSVGIDGTKARKRCGPCRKKKHGKCKKTRPDSTPCGVCLACQGGQCVNRCGICEECPNGSCVPKPDDAPCDGSGKCLTGSCNPVPTCLTGAASVTPCEPPGMPALCCSGHCCVSGAADFHCCVGQTGTPCFGNDNCAGLVCTGYRCM